MDKLFETAGPLYICETILRDAQQSHAATRMKIEDMLPACDVLDSIGYWSIECWGGATFDACLRFLKEDPWERLRALRKALPNTRLQMLLRGQNLLGYRHYPDDVVDAFCRKSIENGIDIVRIFDALNDTRNMEYSMKSVKKYGGTVEAALSYTISPVHNEDYFVRKAVLLEDMGADVICIKDMANLLLPAAAYRLIKKLKEKLSVPVHIHTHNSAGTGSMVYLAAAMAGVDIVDCALSPFADGTSQPATESIAAALKDTVRDTGLDLVRLNTAAGHFRQVARKMEQEGIIDSRVLRVDPKALLYQVPGGMLSNLISQLKEANAENRLDEVLREVPEVRRDFGYPPLVTPTSQIVGTQAVLNVLMGRYATFTKESKALLRGEYGELPGTVNEELLRREAGNDKDNDEDKGNINRKMSGVASGDKENATDNRAGDVTSGGKADNDVTAAVDETDSLTDRAVGALAGTDPANGMDVIRSRYGNIAGTNTVTGTGMDEIRTLYGNIAKTEEDLLSCAMFPQVAPDFIRRRDDLHVHEIDVEWIR